MGAGSAKPSGRLPRARRLKRRRLIRSLFDRTRADVGSVAAGCIRIVYRTALPAEVGGEETLQVGFAPGGRARHAVGRNHIKRILREVYRTHQHALVDLFSDRPDVLVFMILFRGQPAEAARCIPADLPRALTRLARPFARADAFD